MPTRKLPEPEWLDAVGNRVRPCNDSQHNPPTMQVFHAGHYEHECPACHAKSFFHVPEITC